MQLLYCSNKNKANRFFYPIAIKTYTLINKAEFSNLVCGILTPTCPIQILEPSQKSTPLWQRWQIFANRKTSVQTSSPQPNHFGGRTMCDRLTGPRSGSPGTLSCVTGLSNELWPLLDYSCKDAYSDPKEQREQSLTKYPHLTKAFPSSKAWKKH